MVSGIIAFLEARIGILRWVVLGLAMVATAWATHRIDVLRQNEKVMVQIQKELVVIHDGKKTRDRIAAMGDPDVTNRLRDSWTRKD